MFYHSRSQHQRNFIFTLFTSNLYGKKVDILTSFCQSFTVNFCRSLLDARQRLAIIQTNEHLRSFGNGKFCHFQNNFTGKKLHFFGFSFFNLAGYFIQFLFGFASFCRFITCQNKAVNFFIIPANNFCQCASPLVSVD